MPVRVRHRLSAHPLLCDALIAILACVVILVGAVTVAHHPNGGPGFGHRALSPHTAVLTALACAALVLRRRFPMAVLAATVVLAVGEQAIGATVLSLPSPDRHNAVAAAAVIALYTVAGRTDRPTTWRVGGLTVAVLTSSAMLFGPQPWYVADNLGVFAWSALAAAVGEAVRSRRAAVDAIRERAERAERTREEEARRRVAEERMRIARELHDVVAHHIALVNVQAGVAAHVMDSRPDQAQEALAHVREASRHALSELQTTVGLLRGADEPVAPTEPARGLGVLDELVESFTRAGMTVTVDAPGAGGPLPSTVDLAAYRVIQEGLTNVHKHAGPQARAEVSIARSGGPSDRAVEITVRDDGTAPEPPGELPGGHGLLGMRERAEALGGTCEAGPAPDGGFRVRVRLPLRPPRIPGRDDPAPSGRRGLCC
ncbi:sensor histidine kinase [Streptomyces sp. ACA25]|uniref:sensor histidine kinase n=1 Tax=Streptomyces sp. ACA25 TaxID=3022596 RepID=UPI002308153B|nr:sensor histidine kinase [Streptomyces sp. ACA25]MDB1089939.1 sensor histidine kinase [Streptomyces sp. ACA25]